MSGTEARVAALAKGLYEDGRRRRARKRLSRSGVIHRECIKSRAEDRRGGRGDPEDRRRSRWTTR